MSGTVWPSLVAGARAKASEVENKFDWMEGDFIPFTAGTKTDATYDLGSSSFRWVDIWGSGIVTTGAGAVGAPSFTRSDDLDTGMWFPAGNTLAWSVNGTEAMRINPSAQVGIGKTPSQLFEVDLSSSGSINRFNFSNSSNTANSGSKMSIVVEGSSADDPWLAFTIGGGAETFSMGLDNSDSDKFKISDNDALGTNDRFVIDSAGHITQPAQPSFLAYKNTVQSNATGDGTIVTVAFETEVYDQNVDFSGSTFTAPATGRYTLTATVNYLNMTSSAKTAGNLRMVTSNATYFQRLDYVGLTLVSATITAVADMDASDTAFIQTAVVGGSKDVDFDGNAARGTSYTFFSGSLIN